MQLSLFSCDLPELESAALLVAELDAELLDIQGESKKLTESISVERKDINARLKDVRERRAAASKALYGLKRAGV